MINKSFAVLGLGKFRESVVRELYEAGADMVVLGPPALWNKDRDIEKAWGIMEREVEEELSGVNRK